MPGLLANMREQSVWRQCELLVGLVASSPPSYSAATAAALGALLRDEPAGAVSVVQFARDPGLYPSWNILNAAFAHAPYRTNWRARAAPHRTALPRAVSNRLSRARRAARNPDDRRSAWALEKAARVLDAMPWVDLVAAPVRQTSSPNNTWANTSAAKARRARCAARAHAAAATLTAMASGGGRGAPPPARCCASWLVTHCRAR